jgi:hypothetical protein
MTDLLVLTIIVGFTLASLGLIEVLARLGGREGR